MTTLRSTILALGLLAGLVGCTTPTENSTETDLDPTGEAVPDPMVRKPWTTTFSEPALLFANTVHIEGPRGLMDHFAARTVDEYHSYAAETLPEGFRQVFRVERPEAGVELRAYLDALEIVVIDELVVLERPGEHDVIVRAVGEVYWRETNSGREQRAAQLSLSGPVEETGPYVPPTEERSGDSDLSELGTVDTAPSSDIEEN